MSKRSVRAWCLLALLAGLLVVGRGAAQASSGWFDVELPEPGLTLHGLIEVDDGFLAYGARGLILTSPDGLTWERQESGVPSDLWAAAWNGSTYVIVGDRGTILISSDARQWRPREVPTSFQFEGVAWNGDRFVVAGQFGEIFFSPDGENWLPRDSETFDFFLDLVWNGTRFVGPTAEGSIHTSEDGFEWALRREAPGVVNPFLEAIVWDGSRFIAAGGNGRFVASDDGLSWTDLEIDVDDGDPFERFIYGLAFDGASYVAVGDAGTMIRSTDALIWQTVELPEAPVGRLYDILWTGERYLVVGQDRILASTKPESGWWISNEAASNGFAIEFRDGFIFAAAFSYAEDGTPLFYTGQAPYRALAQGGLGTFESALFVTSGGTCPACEPQTGETEESSLGSWQVRFTGATTGELTWAGKTIPIQRFRYAEGEAPADGFGWWISGDAPSNGFAIERQADIVFLAAFTYGEDGAPTFYTAQGAAEGPAAQLLRSALSETEGGTCPGCESSQGTTGPSGLGELELEFLEDGTALLLWNGATIPLRRFEFN